MTGPAIQPSTAPPVVPSNAPPTDPSTGPISLGTPARPAFVRRRGLFAVLFLTYLVWMGFLVAMSVRLHHPH